MSHPAIEQFEVVRRGYDPQQVERRVAGLTDALESTRRHTMELERHVEELARQVAEQPVATPSTAYAGLGARVEQILTLAEQESGELRATAIEDAERHRSLTEQAADVLRVEAERYAQERRSEVDAEAARVIEDARRQADQMRDEADRDTKARREEADAFFERNRAHAAQAAADFESTLAHRREQSERDFTQKIDGQQAQLAAVQQRAEQLRVESDALRADADRKTTRTIDDALRRADDLVAEAKTTVERIRSESERELAAATQRRDSINAQLTNVRQMLATLTGATLPNPIGSEDGATPTPAAGNGSAPAPAAGPAGGSTVTASPAEGASPPGPAAAPPEVKPVDLAKPVVAATSGARRVIIVDKAPSRTTR